MRRAQRKQAVGLLILGGLAAACNDEPTGPNIPAVIQANVTTELRVAAGTVVNPAPTFVVRDASGRTVANAAITITIGEGGGVLANTPTRTLGGPTSLGQWTLGQRAGRNTVRIVVAGVAPLEIAVTGIPGPPASVQVVSGNDQVGLAGASLAQPLVAAVADQFGNGISGTTVTLTSASIGASFTPSTVTTNADGHTPPIAWTLGRRGDAQVARATANALSTTFAASVRSDFLIDVRFSDATPQGARDVFLSAANRIRALIVGDVADATLTNVDPSRCGGPAGTVLNEVADDIIIYADVSNIDGPGKVLGRAGPCFVRATSLFPLIGTMQFDAADTPGLLSSGRFEAVVMHEMLHVIGIGTLWRSKALVDGLGTADPRFIGPAGLAACLTIGFTFACQGSVPIENAGGSGTVEAHWRESVFDAELMTGFAESTPNMPFSALTLGALEDYGYTVNYLAVDPFGFGALRRPAPPAADERLAFDIALEPIGEIGPGGWLRRYR